MLYTLEEAPKKVQYIVIDSNFISRGSSNNFVIDFNNNSNVFIQEMKDVVGINLVDFYITQVGTNDNGTFDSIKYLDIKCKEVPISGQMLTERNGMILGRVPIERNYSGSNTIVVHDKQWKGPYRSKNFFNPISIKQLSFEVYEQQGDGDYLPLRPSCYFFMVIEVYTLDHKAPPPAPDRRLEKIISKLSDKIDKLSFDKFEKFLETQKPSKIPFKYLVLVLILSIAGFFYFRKKSPHSVAINPAGPAGP